MTHEDVIREYELNRAVELTAGERKRLAKALPDGYELVEGDFADDEKWRVVAPAPAPDAPAEPEGDPVHIADCEQCGQPIHEHEARVEDARGLWHPEHYEQ